MHDPLCALARAPMAVLACDLTWALVTVSVGGSIRALVTVLLCLTIQGNGNYLDV